MTVDVEKKSADYQRGYCRGYQRGHAKAFQRAMTMLEGLRAQSERGWDVAKQWRERAIAAGWRKP